MSIARSVKSKKIVILFFSLLMLLGVNGCMNNKIDYSGEAKKYLENKYNQDFSLVEVIYPSVDIPYAEILFQSERYPNETIIVCRESGTFSDNYYGIMARDVCRTKISFILNKYFEENKYFN